MALSEYEEGTKREMADTYYFSGEKVIDRHDARLYETAQIAQGIAGGFDAVTDDHIAQYRELGFLSIENAFTPHEMQDAITGLRHLIDGGNPDFKGVEFEVAVREILPTLTSDERQDSVRKIMYFAKFEPRLDAIAHHPKLVALAARLLEASVEKTVMFQDMALLKPPRLGSEKPWHQDKAYFNVDTREPIVGVWIALDEATVANGCMHLLPQLKLQPVPHFLRRDWQICDTETLATGCIAAPLKPGGVLLFDGFLAHGTPHNTTESRRRALQFHYQSNRYARIDDAARMAIYGGEGKEVRC